MSKTYTQDEAIALKKKCFKSLTQTLESFIAKPVPASSDDTDYVKKAALIAKWLNQYANYLSFEEKFNPSKNISYKRGDVIFANFGFNIGAELGGEHYAVVLDKESHHNSSTVTVLPLSSLKTGKSIHPNDLYLGSELFEKMHLKSKTLVASLKEQCESHQLMLQIIIEKAIASSNIDNEETANPELDSLITDLEKKVQKLTEEITNAERLQREIMSLKIGSIAKIKQITTISKIRIYNPKKSSDPLYGIRLSEESMNKINEKMKEHFIF